MNTATKNRADVDIDVVRKALQAAAAGDVAGFAAAFHPEATWNHRNPDRLGGIKRGIAAIGGFLAESNELTSGTLAPIPQNFLADGAGHVAVLVRLIASRADGRTLDDTQIVYFSLDDGMIQSVEHFVGDPPGLTEFWA